MRRWGVTCGLIGALLALIVGGGIEAMTHGYPPWSGISKQTVFTLPIDMGELAVRLGSPVSYDRRGDVVVLESFHDGLGAWITEEIGTGASLNLSCISARTGAYSVQLVTGTTGSMMTGVSRYQHRPVLGQIGLEASFAAVSADPQTMLVIYHYTGTGYYLFRLRYDYATELLQFFNSAGAWETVDSGIAFYPERRSYNPMKLVVDLVHNEYNRALFTDSEYSLDGEGGFFVAGASAPYLAIGAYAVGAAAGNYTVYLDDIILTQNEP